MFFLLFYRQKRGGEPINHKRIDFLSQKISFIFVFMISFTFYPLPYEAAPGWIKQCCRQSTDNVSL